MEDPGSAEDFLPSQKNYRKRKICWSDDNAPIIKLINAMLAEAIKEGASDIHIETFEKSLRSVFVLTAHYMKCCAPVANWPRYWYRVSR